MPRKQKDGVVWRGRVGRVSFVSVEMCAEGRWILAPGLLARHASWSSSAVARQDTNTLWWRPARHAFWLETGPAGCPTVWTLDEQVNQ